MREKFYYAILSNGLTKLECKLRKMKSRVPNKNLMIIKDNLGRYRLIRKVYQHEFKGDRKWRRSIRVWDHPRVLKWLKLQKKKAGAK